MRIEEAIKNIEDSIIAAYPQIKGISVFRPYWGGLESTIIEFVIYYQMYGVPQEYNGNILEWYKAELLPLLEDSIKDMTSRRKRILANKINCPRDIIYEEWYKFYLIYEIAPLANQLNKDACRWIIEACKKTKNERDYADRRINQSPA